MKRIFLPIFVVLLLLFPVSAAEVTPVDVLYDTASVSQWNAYLGGKPFGELSAAESWQLLDGPVRSAGIGAMDSHATLERRLLTFERKYADVRNGLLQSFVNLVLDVDAISPVIDYDSSLGIYRLKDSRSGIWIVSLDGSFPYYRPSSTVDPDTGETSVSLGGQWIQYGKVNWNRVNLLTEYSLYDIGYALRDIGQDNDVKAHFSGGSPKYQYIASRWTAGAVGEHYVYCDEDGQPYVYRPNPDEWAQEDDNNYYTDDDGDNIYDDGDTENNKLIDLDSNTIWFPGGTLLYIDNMVLDESTKTYYVDAHQEYDIDNNTYITNNYHYEYHINYTSVTYIGQTEEYDEKYEFYYELPDGRSSADLTADELLVLNTQIDVLPYVRSADDVSIRALYHFDGNTRDSSYWSHLGNFKWNSGATLTYMDVGAFNGALYLDENAHDFTVTLPKNLGTGDFTIQFRYYQSHTEAPQSDSYIQINDWRPMVFTGTNFTSNKGNVFAATPIGQWNEICIQRSSGTTYWFVNGVCVNTGTGQSSTAFGNQIQFVFGSEQQTYKYFDELRVVTKALYPSSGYTPSAVPFDTNLTLVLPDSQLPVADAYWTFNSSKTNILSDWGFANFVDYYSSNTYTSSSSPSRSSYTGEYGYTNMVYPGSNPSNPVAFYNSYLTPFTTSSSGSYFGAVSRSITGLSLTTNKVKAYRDSSASSYVDYVVPYSFSIYAFMGGKGDFNTLKANTSYTFSMVSSTGEVGSLTFKTPSSWSGSTFSDSFKSVNFNGYQLFYSLATTDGYVNTASFGLRPSAFGDAGEFVYLELVEGTSTDLSAEYIESVVVMDKDDLNTPSLAVRTDLDITGYQIGGVRPSLPTEGLVWALVEGSRITSLQIYDGQAWEQVDGRIWTGSRWVPYYAYDVLLLKDMWDIVEADPTLDPIYTETGFWTWLQNAWGGMINRLDAIIAALGGSAPGGSTSSPDSSTAFPGEEDDPTTDEDEGWVLIDLLVILKDGAWTIVKGVVTTGVNGISGLAQGVSDLGGFFDAYRPDTSGGVLDIMNQGGSAVWD